MEEYFFMRDGKSLPIPSKDDPRNNLLMENLIPNQDQMTSSTFKVLKVKRIWQDPDQKLKIVDIKEDTGKILTVNQEIQIGRPIKNRDEEEILANPKDKEEAYKNMILPKKIELYYQYIDNII